MRWALTTEVAACTACSRASSGLPVTAGWTSAGTGSAAVTGATPSAGAAVTSSEVKIVS